MSQAFFTRKFIGQTPQTKAATQMHLDMSQEQFYAEICRKNAVPQRQHQDKAAALPPNIRTVHRGNIVWGTKVYGMGPDFGTKMKYATLKKIYHNLVMQIIFLGVHYKN